jgi:hypothetical protein
VAANPQDGTVVSAALHWLQRNVQHEKRYELLCSLVAHAYDNPLVQHEVQMWWEANSGHPNAYKLLGTLITRSKGDPRWTAAGEEFLLQAERRGREYVTAALLSASQADCRFIELTVEALRAAKTKQRNYLRFQMRRALANHVSRALEYSGSHSITM